MREIYGFDCEPTYEELKHSQYRDIFVVDEDCEPTYEELKLSAISGEVLSLSLLRAYL